MTRINIYNFDDNAQERVLQGWFDAESATVYHEAKSWDGNNHISVVTGSQWEHESLYRTPGGRWVLRRWSNWQDRGESYEFVTEDQAREWLLINGEDEVVAALWGEIESESGPEPVSRGGRPEVGAPINVRLGDELLAQVDEFAAERGTSRAETLRSLLTTALRAEKPFNVQLCDPATNRWEDVEERFSSLTEALERRDKLTRRHGGVLFAHRVVDEQGRVQEYQDA